ncbi:hypothetical protein GCM10022247_27230 [Allokutzneria multivorans]|uniref:Ricin B lectin domain-containing protein n=1 Tax=Allokutzneria multivorans TaxID=1142134 RepID=A0ABP7S081_9PSEU
MRVFSRFASVVAAAALVLTSLAVPASAAPLVRYRTGLHFGLCLDVRGGAGASGQDMQLWHCGEVPGQRWEKRGEQLASDLNRGLCLDVRGGIGAAGQDVQLWRCGNIAGQRWVRDGLLLRSGLNYHLCLDVRGGSGKPDQDVQLWTCDSNNAAQHWYEV